MSAPPFTPFDDPAKPVLEQDPAIDDPQREKLWDLFHGSKDANELATHLKDIAVPDDTKRRLFTAKQAVTPATDPVAATVSVMTQLSQMDPTVLATAEAHPNVLKTLTAAAGVGAKPAGEAQGTTSGKSKGKTSTGAKPLEQPPRIDGEPHLPPIDDSMYRVLASDGSVHDIPKEHIEKARVIDPRLHVLNP